MGPIVLSHLGQSGRISLAARYEKRFTTVDDVTHDPDHIHDFYEIYLNLAGDVSFLVEDRLYALRRGDVILTSPREIHRCIYHSDCIHEHICIWIKDFSFTDPQPTLGRERHISLPSEERTQLISLCLALCKHLEAQGDHTFAALHSFYGVLSMIFSGGGQRAEGPSLPKTFSDIVDHITRHYAEAGCTVASLCNTFYISKSTLCRQFSRYFQTTPSKYIESKRLSEAKKLLLAGASVQDACFASGFSDCSYFILRFRKKFGITPYHYQKESKQEEV